MKNINWNATNTNRRNQGFLTGDSAIGGHPNNAVMPAFMTTFDQMNPVKSDTSGIGRTSGANF